MEVIGKIKAINPEQQVSAAFKKRELVVTTDEQYPQHILVEFTQDKCDLLSNYNIGEAVKVSINLRGREWINPQGETRYFNSIQGWRIERENSQPAIANGHPGGSAADAYFANKNPAQAFTPATNINEDEADDLPF